MADITLSDLRGGRNGVDSPLLVQQPFCCEAVNVDFEDGPVATKRRGATVVSTGAVDLSAGVYAWYRHVPGGDEGQAELWCVTVAGVVARCTTAGWAVVALDDAITGEYQNVEFKTFNGKLFMAYKSAVNRLHVWDSVLNVVRRVGMAQPSAAPTVANTGAGTYAATLRYYRVRFIQYDGTTVSRRSEPSASVAFTPSGTGTAARVTKPATVSERETHWEVEVSTDGTTFVVLAGVAAGNAIAIATTTYDDTATSYSGLTTSEESGLFNLPTSVRYLATDGNKLLMAGTYGSEKTSRIWFTPALGSADHGDDERISNTSSVKGWIDLNEKDGGEVKGLADAIGGTPAAFKNRQTYKLVPTGDVTAPYNPRRISSAIGCIASKSIVQAEDAGGNPVIAWLSHKGPYRFGAEGFVKIGRDVDDVWFGLWGDYENLPVNLSASIVVGHGVYHTDRHQIWWWFARGSNNSPDIRISVDVRRNVTQDQFGMRGGWVVHTGKSCKAVASVMFANTIGSPMSKDLKPYVSYLAV